jgi:thiol:disulfide interchange protein DsbC
MLYLQNDTYDMGKRLMKNILITIGNKMNGTGGAVLVVTVLFVFISFLSGGNVFAFGEGGCDGECNKCHALTKMEAIDIMKKLKIPDPKVRDIRMSPIKGLWEVSIDSQGKSGLFYIAFSKNYIVQGQIVEVSTGIDKTREQYQILQDSKKIDISQISLANALVLGDRKAKKRVIVFTDPDCPFCGRLHDEMRKVVEKRKDIVFYIRLYPLVKLHPDSYWKSKAIVCNKSMQMLEDNFAKKPITRTECNSKEVDNTIKLAEKLGITGTPTLVFSNGKMRSGTMSAEQMIDLVDGKK